MTEPQQVRQALAAVGVPEEFAQVVPGDAQRIPGGQVPDRWYVTPVSGSAWVVGAFDRGSFTPYDSYDSVELAVNAVRHLWAAPVTPVPVAPAAAQQGLDRARGLERIVRAGTPVVAADLVPGTVFDTYGTLTNHTMFVWRTPFPARSSPPTELHRPYTTLVVRDVLPDPVRTGVMAPAFEQPGGGVAVSLPRCLRWYFDAGLLDVVADSEAR